MLEKRVTKQWYDPKMSRVSCRIVLFAARARTAATPKLTRDQCEVCGTTYEASCTFESAIDDFSDATPELRDTAHWWLDMWKVAEPLKDLD